MTDIIQQLKAYDKPFGLMSEEMKQKAREINAGFELYKGKQKWEACGIACDFSDDAIYRLRPGYEEKPEIVECEIYEGYIGHLTYSRGDTFIACTITCASRDPDFIGFKFGDLKQVINKAVGYSHNDVDIQPFVQYDDLKSGKYKVLHATHVLFRGQK